MQYKQQFLIMEEIKYWMKFVDNDNETILSISDLAFMGVILDIDKLKSRFNNDFVKNKACKGVQISFLGAGINACFVAGFNKEQDIEIVNTHTGVRMTSKEFSEQLNILERILEREPPELCYE